MVNSIEEVKSRLNEISEDLKLVDNKREILEYFLEMGTSLEKDSSLRKDRYRVPGCLSDVYIKVDVNDEDIVNVKGFTSSLILKGFLVLVEETINGLPKSVAESEELEKIFLDFAEKSQLTSSEVSTRAVSFSNILEHIRDYLE